jgi:hypothetical protein
MFKGRANDTNKIARPSKEPRIRQGDRVKAR